MEQQKSTLSLNALAFGDTVTGALPGCTTIDGDNNDNGFLGCARVKNLGASSHFSTGEAVAKLNQCMTGVGRPNIVGHGSDGIIVTGTGDDATNPDKYISLWNQSYWEPYVKQLKGRISGLSLWACHPGTGQNGADFLFSLARVVNAPVAGPTGFVYCSNTAPDLFLEPRSVWQIATPSHRPNPIASPTPYFHFGIMNLSLNFGSNVEMISSQSIISIEYIAGKNVDSPALFTLTGNSAADLVNLIKFDSPFFPGGTPAAIITGKLIVTFERNKRREQRDFVVYNNRLLEDTTYRGTFYYCAEGFRDAIQLIR